MSPTLGDPTSMSALAATMRRTGLQLRADGEQLGRALEDATPGWSGPSAATTRRRADAIADSLTDVAQTLDECGRSLQSSAARLAETIAGLRALDEEARARGLTVEDGIVRQLWGITGVADAGAHSEGERARDALQERVRHLLAALGRDRARLTRDAVRAEESLRSASTRLRA